jgi:hypothetical protein
MYLSLHCSATSQEASLLETDKYQIGVNGQSTILHRVFKGRGSSVQPPFVAVETGFELHEYDQALFEHWTDLLFAELFSNAPVISKWKDSKSVSSAFIVNINSMNEEHRPVFFLRPEQMELLASFGASIAFDGYLMFPDSDEPA